MGLIKLGHVEYFASASYGHGQLGTGRQEAELFGRFSAPGNNSEGQGTKSHWGAHGTASVQDATRDAAKLLFEIKDVRDELNILKTIAEYQGKVQSLMDDNGPSDTDDGFDEDLTAKYVTKDIKELDGLAKKTEDALHTTITLYESEIANLQAKEAADQGKRVMVFTVVTVWFPLGGL
ncbi:hypothetical protein K4K56_003099 [Colletotrichum sp. SAR 10_98]|nr:hypothetical protein K4K56_003099 [Colletotrichum sp. SAR 10_98]